MCGQADQQLSVDGQPESAIHLIDLVCLAIDLPPPLKACCVKVGTHSVLLAAASSGGLGRAPAHLSHVLQSVCMCHLPSTVLHTADNMRDARTSSGDLLLTELPTGLQWQHRHQWPEGMRCWHLQCQRLHLPLRLPLAEPPCTALLLQQPLSLPACIHGMRAAVCADALQDGWQIRASAPAHAPSRQGIWQCCDPACWQIC